MMVLMAGRHRKSPLRTGGALFAVLAVLATFVPAGVIVAAPASAAPGTGFITVHNEAISEDADQPFSYSVTPSAGATSSFTLNDATSVGASVSPQDLGSSQDVDQSALWAVGLAGGGCGTTPNGCVYVRPAATSTWTKLPTTISAKRVSGAAAANQAYYLTSAGTVFFWNGTAAVSLSTPPSCTGSDLTSNGAVLIVSCTTGKIYRYTGNFAGTNSYVQLTGLTGYDVSLSAANVLVYDNATVNVLKSTINPATNTAGAPVTVGAPSTKTVSDVATSADGAIYAVAMPTTQTNPFGYHFNGTTFVEESETRDSVRITAARGDRAWTVNNRGVESSAATLLGATIFARDADGTWYDDERIKTVSPGNTIDLPVAAGTYTITENSAANWRNQAIVCVAGTGDTATTSITNSGGTAGSTTITIGGGGHVSCIFQNLFVTAATTVTSNCTNPYLNTFGNGAAGISTPLPPGQTSYHYNPDPTVATNDGFYTVVTRGRDVGIFVSPTFFDHTTANGTGNFLAVNASYDPGVIFEQAFTGGVVGIPYTFSAYVARLDNAAINPNVTFRVIDLPTGDVLGSYSSGNVSTDGWKQYGFSFIAPTPNFSLELVNNATGGNGNDLAIDDINFGLTCVPVTTTAALGSVRVNTTDQFTVAMHSGSPAGPVVNSTIKSTTTGAGSTVGAGTGTTGSTSLPADVPVYITEAPTGGANLALYDTTITCTDANGIQSGLPSGAAFSGSYALTPAVGASISCVLTNTLRPANLTVSKSVSPGSGTPVNQGDTLTYTLTFDNSSGGQAAPVSYTDYVTGVIDDATVVAGPTAQGALTTTAVTTSSGVSSFQIGGTVAMGGSQTVSYSVRVKTPDTGDHSLDNYLQSGARGVNPPPLSCVAGNSRCTTNAVPALTVLKTASRSAVTATGDQIIYTFRITNSGKVPLTAVTVDDTQTTSAGAANGEALDTAPSCQSLTGPAGSCSGTQADLAVGQVATFTATFTTTASDISAGYVSDSATVTGTPSGGGLPVTSPASTVTVLVSALTIEKTADLPSVAHVGDVITYTYLVTNAGLVPLTGLTVDDVQVAPAGPLTSGPTCQSASGSGSCTTTTSAAIPVGGTASFTATYTVTQADLNNGAITGSATATGTPLGGGSPITSPPSTVTVLVSGLTILKTAAAPTVSAAGQVISYTFLVTNTGEVPLAAVTVNDVQTAPAGSLDALPACKTATGSASSCATDGTSAAVGIGGTATFTATYTTTSADIAHKRIADVATATGTPPGGAAPITSPLCRETVLVAALTIVKTSDRPSVAHVGDVVTYTYAVTNTGSTNLTDVFVTDNQDAPAGSVDATPICLALSGPTGTCSATSTDLAAGQTASFTATYTVTQADLTNSEITGAATATGTPPGTGAAPLTSPPATVTVLVAALTIVKTADTPSVSAVGQTINYTFLVTNTGTVPLTAVTVTDVQTAPAGSLDALPACQSATGSASSCASGGATATLGIGGTATFTAAYVTTAADLLNDAIADSATATGTPPGSGAAPLTSPRSTVNVLVAALTIVKTADIPSVSAVGQTITYTFVVTNTGSVPLTAVTVANTQFAPAGALSSGPVCQRASGSGSCNTSTTASIPVGGTATYTATYVTTEADLVEGTVTGSAIATGTPPGAPAVASPPSIVAVPAGELTIVKTADQASVAHVGDVITYSFSVSNTGASNLSDVFVTDTQKAPARPLSAAPVCLALSGPAGTCNATSTNLVAGQKATFTASYKVTPADLSNGAVTDSATATGTLPGGISSITSTPAARSVPVAGITVTKTASVASVSRIAEVVTYSFRVTNTGRTVLTGIGVNDAPAAPSGVLTSAATCPSSTLAARASETCTATYTVTAADVTHGSVQDTATAHGIRPGPVLLVSTSSTLRLPVGLAVVAVVIPAAPASLPYTGADIQRHMLLAVVLLTLGSGLVLAGRRRRRT